MYMALGNGALLSPRRPVRCRGRFLAMEADWMCKVPVIAASGI